MSLMAKRGPSYLWAEPGRTFQASQMRDSTPQVAKLTGLVPRLMKSGRLESRRMGTVSPRGARFKSY